MAAEVEDAHGVPVEVVCVGDAPVTEDDRPLVLATREAIVNAARHSGAGTVDVYAEATAAGSRSSCATAVPASTPTASPRTGTGVRSSIVGRMERHGGTASVRSVPGEGTEVRLSLPAHAHRSTHRTRETP